MKQKIILITILILASLLRLWSLASYPSGFNADEAALGYNAYSLLQTGRDEHGHPWPVNLESFGDFKPAGYTYILLPFIKVLGLNEFAVRLPSALFGILSVLFIYLLTREVVDENVGLIAALLLAVSPWHLQFSRGGWEVNVATTLMLIGVWSVVKWLKVKKVKFLLVFTVSLVLSMYVYQSARLLAPVIGIGILMVYWRQFLANFKQDLLVAFVTVALLIPLGISVIKTDAGSRLSGVGLLADLGPLNRVNELRGHYSLINPPWYVKVLYNRLTGYSLQFVYNYLSHFDGNFLFVNGDAIERSKIPETGLLYLTDFVFVLMGSFVLVRRKNDYSAIIWLWLFVAPLAAAVTFQVPHALRAQDMVIPLTVLTAAGMGSLIKYKKILIAPLVVLYVWQVARYLHEYYIHYPQAYPASWEYGFKDLVTYVSSVEGSYSKVWVTDKYDQPYILFLFYQKYNPAQFQGHHSLTFRDKFNFSTVRDYDKFHFGVSAPPIGALVVAAPEEVPATQTDIIKTISFPNGKPAFEIYEQK